MAVLDTVRLQTQDTGTSPRFSDAELTAMIDDAVMELNVWTDATWLSSDLDIIPCLIPLSHQQIFFLLVRIRIVDAILTNTDKSIKMVTQDTQFDASNVLTRLNRTKMLLEQELDRKLTYWVGIKHGAAIKHTGQEWGGG